MFNLQSLSSKGKHRRKWRIEAMCPYTSRLSPLWGNLPETGSSCQGSEEVQISESVVQTGFIGDMRSWKRTGLAQVGEKGRSKRDTLLRRLI